MLFRLPPQSIGKAVWIGCGLACLLACPLMADEPATAPAYGEFPSLRDGAEMLGELVAVDPINRRGLLRPGGEVTPDRYNRFPGQPFALLPYGAVYCHSAPAELKDIPLGTVLHGVFFRPPKGDDSIPKPEPKSAAERQRAAYFKEHTHALLLEDRASYYGRQGQAWRVERIETSEQDGRRFLVVTAVGKQVTAGPSGEQKFCIDKSLRVWKGKESASLDDMQPGQTVQLNLTWDPSWGYGKFHVLELWLDQQSLALAAERQRQTHIRYQQHHWLPGWVDKVTYERGQPNGSGVVEVTLFAGLDASLYKEVSESRSAQLAIAEPTLRTFRKDQDAQGGPIIEVKKQAAPPPGSSGIQLRVQVRHVLEGFRTGGIVRVGIPGFPASILPPEERATDRSSIFSAP